MGFKGISEAIHGILRLSGAFRDVPRSFDGFQGCTNDEPGAPKGFQGRFSGIPGDVSLKFPRKPSKSPESGTLLKVPEKPLYALKLLNLKNPCSRVFQERSWSSPGISGPLQGVSGGFRCVLWTFRAFQEYC